MSKLLKQRKELIENNNDLQKQMDNLLKENEEMKKTSILMFKSSTRMKNFIYIVAIQKYTITFNKQNVELLKDLRKFERENRKIIEYNLVKFLFLYSINHKN